MNNAFKSTILCLSLGVVFSFTKANAAITITDFSVTANSISLTFAGTIPAPSPIDNPTYLMIVNTDTSNGYIFAQQMYTNASSVSFSGTQSFDSFLVSDPTFGDYAVGHLTANLFVGEDFSGTLTATWDDDILRPENITNLSNIHIYWGSNGFDMTSGTFLAAVPEPSTVALLSAGTAAALVLAMRRRRNKA